MYEHKTQPLPQLHLFVARVPKHLLLTLILFVLSLGCGILGYRFLEHLSWIDAFLNVSILLGGMGPVEKLSIFPRKIFASLYSLFLGVIFVAGAGITIAPFMSNSPSIALTKSG